MSKQDLPVADVADYVIAPLVRETLTSDAAAELATKLKALADPVRSRLISAVRV